MPTWRRRNEYLATERNAVRLQQTMRVLAETTDMPGQVHLEISSREVAEKQKVLRKVQAEIRERAKQEALEEAEQLRAELTARPPLTALRAKARKRSRLMATVTLAIGLIGVVSGGVVLAGGGQIVLLIVGAVMALAGVSLLVALARPVAMVAVPEAVFEQETAPSTVAAQPLRDLADPLPTAVPQAEPLRPGAWIPPVLPAPLYSAEGSVAAASMARQDAQDALRRAALAQVLAERAAELAPEAPVSIAPAAVAERAAGSGAARAGAAAAPVAGAASDSPAGAPAERPVSRFARMGVVDEYAQGEDLSVDLLARRRNAG
ncbi:hypothetical protein [Mycetocola tolaasinivorans]|uniref:hypothetical protein n=1 Tax=Mycetocola tolaasinivorans TaxID=76635 RepID=UPI0011C43A56|nr:hypothetical protein [Mycetocola tolaasinivorans]